MQHITKSVGKGDVTKMDRRNKYTRMVIKEALYQLLKKNPLNQITVKEICLEAGINQTTFYRNFKDIYDLFETIEQEMVLTAFPDGTIPKNPDKLLEVIADNQIFYKEFFRYHLI